jgi:hypothetical protein
MKIKNRHERTVAAPPERIIGLIADFDRIWPARIAPALGCTDTVCTTPGRCSGKSSIAQVPRVHSG